MQDATSRVTRLSESDPRTWIWKALAGLNAVLLAVAIAVISLAVNIIRDHGREIGQLQQDVAVIQGNRFTSGDALGLMRTLTLERTEALTSLRVEIMQRFDRIEDRIDRIDRGGDDENGRSR